MVKQLLQCQLIAARPGPDDMAALVQTDTVLRREQKYQDIVQHHKNHREPQHEGYIREPDPGDDKQSQAQDRQQSQEPCIIGTHGSHAPQQQTDQLCRAGEAMDRGRSVDIIENVSHDRNTSLS